MKNVFVLLAVCFALLGKAQTDSSRTQLRMEAIRQRIDRDTSLKKHYDDLTFYYNQMFREQWDSLSANSFQLSGYVDTYFAHYTDSVGIDKPQKFPTSAPVSDAFSLNMAMLQGKYISQLFRGTLVLHFGDIPNTAWSSRYNMIQEANAGIALHPRLWLDAGFFRTHLGFESIQPRENMTTSIATTTYFEPYFLSGAKLTFKATSKMLIQVSAFNGFNTFVETNRNKALGFTLNYEFDSNSFLSYNALLTDESPVNTGHHQRLYQNIYYGHKSKRFDFGAEFNFGLQENSKLNDSNATAYMFSGLIAGKYKLKNGKYAIYGRAEIFEDSDEILTGPVLNENHRLVGVNVIGFTLGVEFRPTSKSYLRLEDRWLETQGDERIFRTNHQPTGQRNEIICSLGAWF